MKTFLLIGGIFLIIVAIWNFVTQIINYRRTKDDTTIDPEELKSLKRKCLHYELFSNIVFILLILGSIIDKI